MFKGCCGRFASTMPLGTCWLIRRKTSGRCSDPICTTSAPRSARSSVPKVPDQAWPKLKTRTPFKGPSLRLFGVGVDGRDGAARGFTTATRSSSSLGAGLYSCQGDGDNFAGAPAARTDWPSRVVSTRKSRSATCGLLPISSKSCTTPITQRSFASW